MKVNEARKALVALGASVVVLAAMFGIVIDSEAVAAVASCLAPVLVYAVKNS